MREFLLMVIAIALVSILALPVLIIGSLFRKNKKEYWKAVAIGFDQVGGSLLYGTEDWTISSYTHLQCAAHKRLCWFEKLINFIFGAEHCKKSYINERKEFKLKAKE